MPKFLAAVEYSDCEGSAAADRSDRESISTYLRQQGQLEEDEFLVALRLVISQDEDGRATPPEIHVFAVKAVDFEDAGSRALKLDPVPVRRIAVAMTLERMLAFFKQFSVTLTINGADLQGKEYREIETIDA